MSQKISLRSAFHRIGNPIAIAIHRQIDRVTRSKTERRLEAIVQVLPVLQQLLHLITPAMPIDSSGPALRQVRREFLAEEAGLAAEHTAKKARLVAEFGPCFMQAEREDDGECADANKGASNGE